MTTEQDSLKLMQIKILYSFNNSTQTTYLCRSSQQFAVQTVDVPLHSLLSEEPEMITLGAIELKTCIQQLLQGNPENFKLHSEDYAVYYKDITEQPEEPFVSNGVLSALLASEDSCLIPGRVCQNMSANVLFGNKKSALFSSSTKSSSSSPSPSLTLEIRLKLHTIEGHVVKNAAQPYTQQPLLLLLLLLLRPEHPIQPSYKTRREERKRPYEKMAHSQTPLPASFSTSAYTPAAKATRTLSLPSFPNSNLNSNPNSHSHPHPRHTYRLAEKISTQRYSRDNVEDRFKLAPFFLDKVVLSNAEKRQKRSMPSTPSAPSTQHRQIPLSSTSQLLPQRAVRTRSMFTNTPIMESSPIQEESYSSDDPEYKVGEDEEVLRQRRRKSGRRRREGAGDDNDDNDDDDDDVDVDVDEDVDDDDDEDEDDGNYSATSPATPQQPPYVSKDVPFELPEDLDSKRTHTIPMSKLPENHGLKCINPCCQTLTSINWKYFETEYKPHFSELIRATEFNKKHYEGMLGPLCNACFLFYKNKGFMRPEHVVRKYNQQQRYNQKLKMRNPKDDLESRPALGVLVNKKPLASSPATFPTPSHTPSVINQAIQNKYHSGNSHNSNTNVNVNANANVNANVNSSTNPTPIGQTPEYHELLNQLNVYGGPSTDIDPLPGATPPVVAAKSNTRIINYEALEARRATKQNTRIINIHNDEDKENCPPLSSHNIAPNGSANPPPTAEDFTDFEAMLQSIHEDTNTTWMNFFSSRSPGDQNSPNSKTPVDQNLSLVSASKSTKPNTNTNTNTSPLRSAPAPCSTLSLANMPSSPYLSAGLHSEEEINDELRQLVNMKHSTVSMVNSSPNLANRTDTSHSLMNWHHSGKGMDPSNKDLASTPGSDIYVDNSADHGVEKQGSTKASEVLLLRESLNNSVQYN